MVLITLVEFPDDGAAVKVDLTETVDPAGTAFDVLDVEGFAVDRPKKSIVAASAVPSSSSSSSSSAAAGPVEVG